MSEESVTQPSMKRARGSMLSTNPPLRSSSATTSGLAPSSPRCTRRCTHEAAATCDEVFVMFCRCRSRHQVRSLGRDGGGPQRRRAKSNMPSHMAASVNARRDALLRRRTPTRESSHQPTALDHRVAQAGRDPVGAARSSRVFGSVAAHEVGEPSRPATATRFLLGDRIEHHADGPSGALRPETEVGLLEYMKNLSSSISPTRSSMSRAASTASPALLQSS